jgi:hypothetical protein
VVTALLPAHENRKTRLDFRESLQPARLYPGPGNDTSDRLSRSNLIQTGIDDGKQKYLFVFFYPKLINHRPKRKCFFVTSQ